jgi:putative hydrolase of the HAD superfamily
MAVLREPYEDTAELVQDLLARDVCCGCLSNTNALHWATFFDGNKFPFGTHLDCRIGSHIVKANKPDEAIYRAFERAAGCEGPDISFFDDSPKNVEAATQIGWRAWHIDATGNPVEQIRRHLGL